MVSVKEVGTGDVAASQVARASTHLDFDHTVGSLAQRGSCFNPLTQPVPGAVLAVIGAIAGLVMVRNGWFGGLPVPIIGIGLGLAAATGKGLFKTPAMRAVPSDTEVLWRCPVSTIGNTATALSPTDPQTSDRVPQDVLTLTSAGIHLLNVVAPGEAPAGIGHSDTVSAATAQAVREVLDGVTGLEDFADLAGRKLDALASEHGYLDVLLLDPTNIVYPKNEIRRADVCKRRFVPGYYFEIELIDGTVDRRDILVARAKREELEELLQSHGYNAQLEVS
jgi:hypothetical protein